MRRSKYRMVTPTPQPSVPVMHPVVTANHYWMFSFSKTDSEIDISIKEIFHKQLHEVANSSTYNLETKLAAARLCMYLLISSLDAKDSEFYQACFTKLIGTEFKPKDGSLEEYFEKLAELTETSTDKAKEELAKLYIYMFFYDRESKYSDDKSFAKNAKFATKLSKLIKGESDCVFLIRRTMRYLESRIESNSLSQDPVLSQLLLEIGNTLSLSETTKANLNICKFLLHSINESTDSVSSQSLKTPDSTQQQDPKQMLTSIINAIGLADSGNQKYMEFFYKKLIAYYAKFYQKDEKSAQSAINVQDPNGMTLLHHLLQIFIISEPLIHSLLATENIRQAIKLLISQGADVNIPDQDGNTPLHLAAQIAKKGNLEFLKTMLVPNANVRAKNKKGKTPFDFFGGQFSVSPIDKECFKLIQKHINEHKPSTEDEKQKLEAEKRELERHQGKRVKLWKRREAHKLNLSEEKLNVFQASMDYWLHQNFRSLPLTDNCINQLEKKLEKMQARDSKEIIHDKKVVVDGKEQELKLNFSKGLDRLAWLLRDKKKKAKDPAFELALERLYLTIRDQMDFHLYCATKNRNLEGGAWLSKNELIRQGIVHVPGIGPMTSGQREDNYSFAWLSTEYPDQVIADLEEPMILKADARKALQNTHILIRDEDKVAYRQNRYLYRYQFGKVIYSKRVYTTPAGIVKVIEVIGPKGRKSYTTPAEHAEIATEKTINDIMALDVVEMIRQVHAADPESARELIKEFYAEESSTKDSKDKDSDTIQQQRIQKARELSSLVNKYEASIVTKLPFQTQLSPAPVTSDKKSIDAKAVPEKTETLLEEVYVIDKKDIINIFQATSINNYYRVEEIFELNRRRAKKPYPNCPGIFVRENPFLVDSIYNGKTPLIYAIEKGFTKIRDILLANHANVHKREGDVSSVIGRAYGRDALMAAAEIGDLDTVKLLVEKYHANLAALRDPSTDLDTNENALSLAEKNGHKDVAEYLRSKGALLPKETKEKQKDESHTDTKDDKKKEDPQSQIAVLNCHGRLLLGCDLSLMSVKDEKQIDQSILTKSQKDGVPILIQKGNEYLIYGDSKGDGNWKFTKITSDISYLKDLPFENRRLRRSDEKFTASLINTLKEGHTLLLGKRFRVTNRKIMKPKVDLKENEPDKGFILSVPPTYPIETDVNRGGIKPLNGAHWAVYQEIEINDVALDPWTGVEAKSFAQNILVDKLWKLEKEGLVETYDVDKDPKAVLVLKTKENKYIYINGADKIKQILEKIRDGKGIEGVPLLFYAPSLLKIKLLASTTLSEVYSQLPSINGPETLLLAACNAVDASTPKISYETAKPSIALKDIPIYSDTAHKEHVIDITTTTSSKSTELHKSGSDKKDDASLAPLPLKPPAASTTSSGDEKDQTLTSALVVPPAPMFDPDDAPTPKPCPPKGTGGTTVDVTDDEMMPILEDIQDQSWFDFISAPTLSTHPKSTTSHMDGDEHKAGNKLLAVSTPDDLELKDSKAGYTGYLADFDETTVTPHHTSSPLAPPSVKGAPMFPDPEDMLDDLTSSSTTTGNPSAQAPKGLISIFHSGDKKFDQYLKNKQEGQQGQPKGKSTCLIL